MERERDREEKRERGRDGDGDGDGERGKGGGEERANEYFDIIGFGHKRLRKSLTPSGQPLAI